MAERARLPRQPQRRIKCAKAPSKCHRHAVGRDRQPHAISFALGAKFAPEVRRLGRTRGRGAVIDGAVFTVSCLGASFIR